MTSHNDTTARRHLNICPDSLFSKKRGGGSGPLRRTAADGAPHAKHNVTSSFLISNLHCPSCVSTIKEVIQETCGDEAVWVSPNVVTSVVTVEHRDTPRSSVSAMAKALVEAGFEIDGITSTALIEEEEGSTEDQNAVISDPGPSSVVDNSRPHASGTDISLQNRYYCPDQSAMLQRRTGTQTSLLSRLQKSSTARQRAHLEVCDKCRHTTESAADMPTRVPVGAPRHIAKIGLSIGGFDGANKSDIMASDAVSEPNTPTELGAVSANQKDTERGLWRATIAIGGMTCAVCVNTITQELNKRPWIEKATVNLVSNSATVDFYNENQVSNIVDAIEDLGYEATVDKVTSLAEDNNHKNNNMDERQVDIRINGMFCASCPERIVGTMKWFEDRLEVLSKPTVEHPILRIRYMPDAPLFTIRSIIGAIQATDPKLDATVYHAPTLEERSQMMARRHYYQLMWRMVLALVMAVPSLVIGIVYMSLVSEHNPGRMALMRPVASGISMAQLILFGLATPVYFLSASVFHVRAIKELHTMWRHGSRTPLAQRFYKFGSMNMLMSLGTSIAYFASVGQMIAAAAKDADHTPDSEFYFDSVVFLTLFLLIGRLVEQYTKARTGDAVEALVKLRPTTALLVDSGKTEEGTRMVPVDMLELGDVVRVTNGASPPYDGVLIQGDSSFDESSLTGESRPIKKTIGDEIFAGTINKHSPVLVRITGTSGSSMLDQIVAVVREGQTRRAPMEAIADVMTAYFVPAITLVAITTWIVWMVLGLSDALPPDWMSRNGDPEGAVQFSLQFAIAVFVVACPCGLALAAPTAIFVGGGIAAKHGILAKGGGEAFEKASRVDVVVFDKTGTLTVGGEPSVTDAKIYPDGEADNTDTEGALLTALRAVEDNSSHPIARAIGAFCTARLHDIGSVGVDVDDMHEIPGKGMRATCQIRGGEALEILVGNEALLADHQIELSGRVTALLQEWKQQAKSVALVGTRPIDGRWTVAAILAISDPIRDETVLVIRALKARGIKVWMLSGDNASTAQAVAVRIGIDADRVLAGVLPSGKADKIKYLQSTQSQRRGRGRATVAMVGDGINDSPALTAADVGVAIGSGSDVAISSADFVLIKSDLRAVVNLLGLSRCVFKRIKTNFGWAVVYNMVAVPVAAGVFFPIKDGGGHHVRLDPVWAALAMALSSVSVVVSSLLLRSRVPVVGFREVKVEE